MLDRIPAGHWLWSLFVSLLISVLLSTCSANAIEYKDYKKKSTTVEYFRFERIGQTVTITAFDSSRTYSTVVNRGDIRTDHSSVIVSADTRLGTDELEISGHSFPYDDIYSSEVYGLDDKIEIIFYRKTGQDNKAELTRRGNLIVFGGKTTIGEKQFIRGTLLTITGDVEVYGEVGQDVISLFGDIFVGSGAVVRGDIACPDGRVDVSRDASIYGEVMGYDQKEHGRRRSIRKRTNAVSIVGDLNYNRVDGLLPILGVEYSDSDSLLPRLWAKGGYAFNSDRWRYDFGLEQTVWRNGRLSIGGRMFRSLKSDDDWIISDNENHLFTFLVTEDFKDYYEAEGGELYTIFRPYDAVSFRLGYVQEDTKWLEAQPHLWSMFGGDKLFSDNFGRVPFSYRIPAAAEIDSTTNGSLSAGFSLDTRNDDDGYRESSWKAGVLFEYSHPDLQSDFDYRRYRIQLTRYQKVNRSAALMLSATTGMSDGYLPMYKRFYLGGLGTLRGYYHKEFMGSRFWMAKAEYRIQIPRSDLGVSVFWDGGQIANDRKITSDIDVKQDVGFAVHLGDDFKVNIAKRLDGAVNDDPKIYVRAIGVF